MNKQQLYTFGGALLASTALSGAAHALTWGKVTGQTLTFSTTAVSVANTLFSTTASTANSVVLSANGTNRIAARFANVYSATTVPGTAFSVEMSPTGATLGNAALTSAKFLIVGSHGSTFQGTMGADALCANAVGFGTQFVLNGCTAATGTGGLGANQLSLAIGGVLFSGVTFSNASGLATAGNAIQMTGRVYNTSTSGNFEAASTANVITSAVPMTTTVSAKANTTVSATTTPLAFTSLSSSNTGVATATLTMDLVTIALTGTGTYRADLATLSTPALEISSARISVTSALLSSGAIQNVYLTTSSANVRTDNLTAANFSGGTVTFVVNDASHNSYMVSVAFNGTTAIPSAAAGTATISFGLETTNGQALASASGSAAGTSQGGFRAEVNTFNASTNGPYSSYLRIHNNGGVAGTVSITVRNDSHDSGAQLGSTFTTAAIQAGGTMQLSAAEMEGTATSTKLPAGGANIPTADRFGSYTVQVTGPIVGYVQHILFDGQNVADLSAFRNSGVTSNNAAP
jgi:hypothetical protein